MTYGKSVRASMYLSGTGKSENRLGEQVAGGNALPRAPQLDVRSRERESRRGTPGSVAAIALEL